jgi:DNA-3-methyladenine glycosylase
MYNCLNVVTEPEGVPGAVLIRALGIDGASGPGKLCVKLNIDRSYNGVDLCSTESPLWVVKGQPPEAETLRESIRIGISSAQDRVWRFYLSGNPYVSGPRHLGGAVKAKPTRKTRNQSL